MSLRPPWRFIVFLSLAVVLLVACRQATDSGEDTFLLTPRPTVVIVTAEGPYYEPFDAVGGWLTGAGGRSTGAVLDGEYFLSIREADLVAWTYQQRIFGDGVYQVDSRLVTGPEASAFGLIFLAPSDFSSFYYAVITGDGRFDVGYCQDICREQKSLVDGFLLAYAILPNNQTNRLQVELDAGTMTFSVNGVPVSQISGLAYDAPGLVGFIGESSPHGGFQAAFDNLRITESNTVSPGE